MFKNAGTTLDWSLKRCFGERFIDHRDDHAMRHNEHYLPEYISATAPLQALSSHWLPVPLPQLEGIRAHLLLLFRNPIERSRSVYNFERSQHASNDINNHNARQLSFKDYVKWRLEPGTGPVLKNFHTRYCSGNYFGQDIHQLYLQAIVNLEAIALTGLVHRYAESMALFEWGLHQEFPNIDLSWQRQNSSQSVSTSPEERIEIVADELGETFDQLLSENQYDLKLLQFVEDKMNRELAKIVDLDKRMNSIMSRNELLS